MPPPSDIPPRHLPTGRERRARPRPAHSALDDARDLPDRSRTPLPGSDAAMPPARAFHAVERRAFVVPDDRSTGPDGDPILRLARDSHWFGANWRAIRASVEWSGAPCLRPSPAPPPPESPPIAGLSPRH